jgi:uncharacterized protein (DUF305 family)
MNIYNNNINNKLNNKSNPCTDELSDIEYLQHMIPHHQVAIDMSNLLIPNTKNPTILNLCRNIIRVQSYEIWEMSMIEKECMETMFSNDNYILDKNKTVLDIYNSKMSKSKDGDCNPLFFKPNQHSEHMKHMKITEKSYLEHMIQHHQVAIDMSKRLLLHTNNSYLIEFCRKLILDQQREIYYMNNLLLNNSYYNSDIL